MTNQCDYGHETNTEVRVLPIGGDSNVIVCYVHYIGEMRFRKQRELETGPVWEFPKWEELKKYA